MNLTDILRRSAAIALVIASSFAASTAHAQFGVGAGVAAMGNNVLEAGVNLTQVVGNDTLRYGDFGGVLGLYAIGHFRYGYGGLARLNLDVSYVFFPTETIRVASTSEQNKEAVLEVGASLIPIALGTEIVMSNGSVRPYAGAQVTYTIFHRTFAHIQGSDEFDTEDIRSQWAGRNRWGLAFRGGLEFAFGPIALDLGLRYNLASLFDREPVEEPMNYLQLGVNMLFGDIVGESDDGH